MSSSEGLCPVEFERKQPSPARTNASDIAMQHHLQESDRHQLKPALCSSPSSPSHSSSESICVYPSGRLPGATFRSSELAA
eukprot:CAMPEP_0175489992 /NCGR_PEP_ID=MMETSP0096-20121207/1030_1 /TAXON_ID=311494 /ORGANISM="Alexandrium monilatum, Strain CCMP3105" /LENGTH=80 /DNA_ID=CAMNT_0016791897 /DNA_START=309 /DNA_END=548 /DNA_ORIENTATION=-